MCGRFQMLDLNYMDTYERAGEGEVLMKRRRYDMPVLRKVNNACDIVTP